MTSQERKINRLFAIGAVLLLLVWAGFFLANRILYRKLYEFSTVELGETLANYAKTVAGAVPSDWVEALAVGIPELAEKDASQYLQSLVDGEKIYAVAILDTAGNVLFCTDTTVEAGKPNPFWAGDIKSIKAAAMGVPVYGGLRRVGQRYLREAFAPIHDPFGKVVGVIGIEAGASYFSLLATLRRGIWIFNIVSMASVAFLIVLLFFGRREMMRLYSQLRRAATLSGIGMMAATLAHEIKNPLAIIKSAAELIPQSDPDEVKMRVEFINEEVDRLAGIVESHLAVARNREFPKTTQPLTVLVDKVAPRYQEQLAKRGIGLIVEVDEDPQVPYALSPMRQVLYNILKNAEEAVSEGGIIRIKVGRKTAEGKEYGCIRITDNGRGIPPEQLESIFEPFHTTRRGGTGLGLFVARQIVEGHGGKINIESTPGEGTTVEILLPTGK